MDDIKILKYCELLSNKIVAMYSVSKEIADEIVDRSVIHDLIRDAPEWVDHIPLSTWAREIFYEFKINTK